MLSDLDILSLRERGDLLIHPYQEENLGTNSYDLTLGEWCYREQDPFQHSPERNYRHHPLYGGHDGYGRPMFFCNIYKEEDLETMWGSPIKTEKGKMIILAPGENILAHTEEFIGGVRAVTTKMHARSTYGRCSVTVCRCAGLGDEGYFTRWTMEVTNYSRFYHLPLMVGMRIAQLTFEEIGPTRRSYTAGTRQSKYQDGSDIEELVHEWEPSMMLPRLYRDRELTSGKYRAEG